jgi:hypothetical protein
MQLNLCNGVGGTDLGVRIRRQRCLSQGICPGKDVRVVDNTRVLSPLLMPVGGWSHCHAVPAEPRTCNCQVCNSWIHVTDNILKPTSDVSQTPQMKGGIAGLQALLNPPPAPAAPPVVTAGPAATSTAISGGSGTSTAMVGPRPFAVAAHMITWDVRKGHQQ